MTSTDTAGDEGELPRRLRRMISLDGLTHVSRELGISRESLARYLARLDVQAGTLALIEATLARRAERCPRCSSPDRKLHPALQWEGEVMICPHPWHAPEPDESSKGGPDALPG